MKQVAIVQDDLAQAGGGHRVVLAMLAAFPDAPIYTSVHRPEATFPQLADREIHTTPLDRVPLFRRSHRMAFPLMAPAFSRLRVVEDVALISSGGWAHGVQARRKIVFCHTPARWLYQPPERYLGSAGLPAALLRVAAPPLRRWDRRAARSADVYIANSANVQRRIRAIYGIDAEILHPPMGVIDDGPRRPIDRIEPGFLLSVGRMMPYKNMHQVARAFAHLPEHRLVMVGKGPMRDAIAEDLPPNVTLLQDVSDEELRWLFGNCAASVAASYEDFGLTTLEAAAFGRPTVALRWGGFLETVCEDVTGVFFGEPTPAAIAEGVTRVMSQQWDTDVLRRHAERFSQARFVRRLREIVDEVMNEPAG